VVVLVDTSVWIDVFRDASGARRDLLRATIAEDQVLFTRFTELELLQGCRDEKEWDLLSSYLVTQDYLELTPRGWTDAARIYFDLRRRGETVRSPVDCCIAQLALAHEILLLHRDEDFKKIARIRPLQQSWVRWDD
jgi:predicted nucleic acid-binding protein